MLLRQRVTGQLQPRLRTELKRSSSSRRPGSRQVCTGCRQNSIPLRLLSLPRNLTVSLKELRCDAGKMFPSGCSRCTASSLIWCGPKSNSLFLDDAAHLFTHPAESIQTSSAHESTSSLASGAPGVGRSDTDAFSQACERRCSLPRYSRIVPFTDFC